MPTTTSSIRVAVINKIVDFRVKQMSKKFVKELEKNLDSK